MKARNIEWLNNSQYKFELYNYYSSVYLLFIQGILHFFNDSDVANRQAAG